MTVQAVRLNHVVLYVSDLDRSLAFYQAAFGMEVVASEPRIPAVFLRLPRSGNHHDLALMAIGDSYGPKRPGIGVYHVAWQVDTIDELAEAQVTLAELGALVGESSHGSTKSLYAHDPDGHEFEVQWMLPRSAWGEYEHSAPIDALDLRSEIERWSGVGTAAELQPLPRTAGS